MIEIQKPKTYFKIFKSRWEIQDTILVSIFHFLPKLNILN